MLGISFNFSDISWRAWAFVIAGFVIGWWITYRPIQRIKNFFRRPPKLYSLDKNEIKIKWARIEKMARTNQASNLKMALIEADKLFDSVLQDMHFNGSTFRERLKLACQKFEFLQNIWYAHSIRNQIVHEANFTLSQHQINQALKRFKKCLKNLKIF